MLEPVKPFTTSTPNFRAARAVSLSRSAARRLTPSGSPSPQTVAGNMLLCRRSTRSRIACPTG